MPDPVFTVAEPQFDHAADEIVALKPGIYDGSSAVIGDPPQPLFAPEPAKAAGFRMAALGELVAIVETFVQTSPMGHALARRVAAMREAFDAAVFHSSPPPVAPPPVTDPNMDKIKARIAELEKIPFRLPGEQDELDRAKASIGMV